VQHAADLPRRQHGAVKTLLAERAGARRVLDVDQHDAARLPRDAIAQDAAGPLWIDDDNGCDAARHHEPDGQSPERQARRDLGRIRARQARADQAAIAREREQMVSDDARERAGIETEAFDEVWVPALSVLSRGARAQERFEARRTIPGERVSRVDPAFALDLVADGRDSAPAFVGGPTGEEQQRSQAGAPRSVRPPIRHAPSCSHGAQPSRLGTTRQRARHV
jgi:hypothetical protein